MTKCQIIPKLKSCPFCGGKAKFSEVGINGFPKYNKFSVRCENENCAIQPSTKYFNNVTKAINSWNRRINEQKY